MKFLIVLIFLTSCGKSTVLDYVNNTGVPIRSVTNPVFQPYIDSFNAELGLYSSVPVVFGEMDSQFVGLCYKWSVGYREVHVKESFWDVASEKIREELIFHELGHCHLNKTHNDDRITISGYNCPKSVMNTYIFTDAYITNCYNKDYNHYITELGQ